MWTILFNFLLGLPMELSKLGEFLLTPLGSTGFTPLLLISSGGLIFVIGVLLVHFILR